MAGREDEAEQVVVDRVGVRLWRGEGKLASELLNLDPEHLRAPPEVDLPVLRGGHQPRARIARDPVVRPRLQRGDQRILRQILRAPDVAIAETREPRDQARGLNPPNGVDCAR
jgi:hypothetical protein